MIWKNRKTIHDPFNESSILNPFKMKKKIDNIPVQRKL